MCCLCINLFFYQSKNNFDPSVGVIDTSKWSSTSGHQAGSTSGNGSPGFLNQNSSSLSGTGVGGLNPINPNKLINATSSTSLNNPSSTGLSTGNEWSTNVFSRVYFTVLILIVLFYSECCFY